MSGIHPLGRIPRDTRGFAPRPKAILKGVLMIEPESRTSPLSDEALREDAAYDQAVLDHILEQEKIDALYPDDHSHDDFAAARKKPEREFSTQTMLKWRPADLAEVTAKAKSVGLGRSEFIRRAALGRRISVPKFSALDRDLLDSYKVRANQIYATINQLAKLSHLANKGAIPADDVVPMWSVAERETLDLIRKLNDLLAASLEVDA